MEATSAAPTWKLALVAPAATVTVSGTWRASGESVLTGTSIVDGAGAARVIVPVADCPPTRLWGEIVSAVA